MFSCLNSLYYYFLYTGIGPLEISIMKMDLRYTNQLKNSTPSGIEPATMNLCKGLKGGRHVRLITSSTAAGWKMWDPRSHTFLGPSRPVAAEPCNLV
jgi:hypothetical protein